MLNHTTRQAPQADATVTMTKAALDDINPGTLPLAEALQGGDIKVEGNAEAVKELFDLIADSPPAFNVVTP